MSAEDNAATYRNVMHAQKEETGLLEEVSSIIEAMKGLSHNRGTAIERLAQAHTQEIDQLKRAHAHQMCRLRMQHSEQTKNETERSAALVNSFHAKDNEINRLVRILLDKDQEIVQLRQYASHRSGEMQADQKLLDRQWVLVDCQKKQLSKKTEEFAALQAETEEALLPGDLKVATVNILNEEIGAHVQALKVQQCADRFAKNNERKRLKRHRRAYHKRRDILQNRLDTVSKEIVVLNSPFDPSHVVETLERSREIVLAHMKVMLQWLDGTMEKLVEEKISLLEGLERISDEYASERKERIKKIFELSDRCGLRADLKWAQD